MGKHILDLFADPQRRNRSPWVELGFDDCCLHQSVVFREAACLPLRKISLSLRTIGNVVKEQRYQRKAAGLGRAATFIGILYLNHALGAFASLRVSACCSFRRLRVLGGAAVLTKKLPG